MLDQSFSVENLRRILDYENRKGNYLEGVFFPSIERISNQIKNINKELSRLKKSADFKPLIDRRAILKEKKEELIIRELKKISEEITSSDFKISLNKVEIPNAKALYTTNHSPESLFAIKQLQTNLSRIYKIKQANRFQIVSQVKVLLDNELPKIIIRTDIQDFYETLPHETLIKKISEDNLLTFSSKRIIKEILNEYRRKSNSPIGIPRGIGVSAYLAELYMRDVDNEIKQNPNISFYARYVDDIIIIVTPKHTSDNTSYMDFVRNIIQDNFNLKCNTRENKTVEIKLTHPGNIKELEFLGYKFQFGTKDKIRLLLSNKKIDKYKTRIKTAITAYSQSFKSTPVYSRRLLVKRFKFLTGNTRLLNNKNNILIGIYYSNSLLTNTSDLEDLDRYLLSEVNALITNEKLRKRLGLFSFRKGFEQKLFSSFSTNDLKEIGRIWKYNQV